MAKEKFDKLNDFLEENGVEIDSDGNVAQFGCERGLKIASVHGDFLKDGFPLLELFDEGGTVCYMPADPAILRLGQVSGNPEDFTSPVVLHINNNYTDISVKNLVCVERNDPRYIEYLKVAESHFKRFQTVLSETNPELFKEGDCIYDGQGLYTEQMGDSELEELKRTLQESGVTMDADGTIRQRGLECTLIEAYDNDRPWEYPEVELDLGEDDTRFVQVSQIAQAFGLIGGDPENFLLPVILHIDDDYLNFRADNLLWVDYDDERYQEFIRIRVEQIEKNHRKQP